MVIIWCILSIENGKSIPASSILLFTETGDNGWFIVKRLHSFSDAERGDTYYREYPCGFLIMRQQSMAMNAFYSKLRKYEDGRKLRRYKRRWSVKRTNAWLDQFRRLLLRHEHLPATYRTFVYLAYLGITLRRCL